MPLEFSHASLGTKIIVPAIVVGYRFRVGILYLYSANGIDVSTRGFRVGLVFAAIHG